MMNLTANIAQLVAALISMVVLLGGDITAHRDNEHSNYKFYQWLSSSGELLSTKRILLLAVFLGTFTTMAQESWMVVMILAATLLIQSIVLLKERKWKLMDWDKRSGRMLATAMIIVLIAIGVIAYFACQTSEYFAARVTAMFVVMLLPITPLLTMLTAWILSPFENRENS